MGPADRRLSSRQRGYDTRWDKAALRYRMSHPLCCGCQAMDVVAAATVVDHIEPHLGNQDKFWNEANWQPACDWHHNAIKQRLEQLWFAGAIATSELRLDSAYAIALARRTPRQPTTIGVDGW